MTATVRKLANVVSLFSALQAEPTTTDLYVPTPETGRTDLESAFVSSLTIFAIGEKGQEASGRRAAIDLLAHRSTFTVKVSALAASDWKTFLVSQGVERVADVQGRSTEYKQAREELNRTAAAAIENALVAQGWSKGGAQGESKNLRDAAMKRVSYHLRKLVDEKLTADQLTSYGFAWTSLLGDTQTLAKPVKATVPVVPGKMSDQGFARAKELGTEDTILFLGGMLRWLRENAATSAPKHPQGAYHIVGNGVVEWGKALGLKVMAARTVPVPAAPTVPPVRKPRAKKVVA